MIPFVNRFHGHGSLRFVYKNGRAVRSRLMTIKVTTNPHRKDTRIAVVISKKVLKSAVRRNRIRRRIYEYIRTNIARMDGVFDIAIVVSSSELVSMPASDLSTMLNDLMTEVGVYKNIG